MQGIPIETNSNSSTSNSNSNTSTSTTSTSTATNTNQPPTPDGRPVENSGTKPAGVPAPDNNGKPATDTTAQTATTQNGTNQPQTTGDQHHATTDHQTGPMQGILKAINKIETEIATEAIHELDHAAQLNRDLVGEHGPGKSCILRLHQVSTIFAKFLIQEAVLNTHEYKAIDWANRPNIIKKATENVQDEAITLQSQMNEFLRDSVKDIHRLGHIGFGLHKAPPEHPRYQNYIQECKSAIEYYQKPKWAVEEQPPPPPVTPPEPEPPVQAPPPPVTWPPRPQYNQNVSFSRRPQVYQRVAQVAQPVYKYNRQPRGVVRPRS